MYVPKYIYIYKSMHIKFQLYDYNYIIVYDDNYTMNIPLYLFQHRNLNITYCLIVIL